MNIQIGGQIDEKVRSLIDTLETEKTLTKAQFVSLIEGLTPEASQYLQEKARRIAKSHFGNRVYTRGLIEFTNFCLNDCYYCGIRRSNREASRYRLTTEEILSCCETGHGLGFRTFVLQGGEDPYFNDDRMVEIISAIRKGYPDCAITLSIGEKEKASYARYFEAGANRYLLRHETANADHYGLLHPKEQTLENRKRCLHDLKSIGYQVGTGFMVGSPYQTTENLAEDLLFIRELQPEMVGIGPFISHKDTDFAGFANGSCELTLFLISILRLMLPSALLPSTTALGTIDSNGREMGILAGANVLMPNLSPVSVRKKYALYDNKICTGEEAAECRGCLTTRIERIGYRLVVDRGDFSPTGGYEGGLIDVR